jgi:hypothetical protein
MIDGGGGMIDCHVYLAERSRGKLMDLTALSLSVFSEALDALVTKLMFLPASSGSVLMDFTAPDYHGSSLASSGQFLRVRPQGGRSCEYFDIDSGTNRWRMKRRFQWLSYRQYWLF